MFSKSDPVGLVALDTLRGRANNTTHGRVEINDRGDGRKYVERMGTLKAKITYLVRVNGCHWKYETSGQHRKMYCPARVVVFSFLIWISMTLDGC